MTATLLGADIRGYYAALGIQLPDWARSEASVRCFADPGAHRRGDRDPSCSINLAHGAWHCHACGARGGAFDAAIARGYADRQAIDLMVAYGLTTHRASGGPTRRAGRRATSRPHAAGSGARPTLQVGEGDVARWRAALADDTDLIVRLTQERGWLFATMLELDLGVDVDRVTIPIRDDRSRLIGLLRYHPRPGPGVAKTLAAAGSRRSLLPHPAAEASRRVLLVEGEPDMIAARSRGLPAIAVPGVDSWQRGWSSLLAGRQVTIVMDCDSPGRRAAAAIAEELASTADVRVADLAPERNDGYDLTQWLLGNKRPEVWP